MVCLTNYPRGYDLAQWALLYSDDGMIASGSRRKELGLLLHMFILVLLNVPLSKKKAHGDVEAEWIGYWFAMARFELGVQQQGQLGGTLAQQQGHGGQGEIRRTSRRTGPPPVHHLRDRNPPPFCHCTPGWRRAGGFPGRMFP